MKKILTLIIFTAFSLTANAIDMQQIFSDHTITNRPGDIYKFVDGNNTCYIVSAKFSLGKQEDIACLKNK